MKFTLPFVSPISDTTVLQPLRSTWIYKAATYSVFLQIIISCMLILWKWKLLPPLIPLWFSKPWGQERLANPLFLLVIPFSGLIIYSINVFLVRFVYQLHPIYARILLLASFVVSCFCLFIVIGIIQLVT